MGVLSKKAIYADLLELDIPEGDTGTYELLNGEIVRQPSRTTIHQKTLGKFLVKLADYNQEKKLGEIFLSPYDVYLDDYNAGIQPDLLFTSHQRSFVIQESGIFGAPDLVIEILSKGTAAKDRGIKKDIYEQFAVREYWIVDPQARSIEVYQMENDRYRLVLFAAEEGIIKSSVLTDLELDISTVF